MTRRSYTSIVFALLIAWAVFAVPIEAQERTSRNCFTVEENGVPREVCVTAPEPARQSAQTAPATGFNRQGIFGCSQTGSYSMSVGSLAAIGGAYVPVNDAAVTLNTGYLVYKECVLKGVNTRIREDSIARLVSNATRQFTTGRSGGPMYPEILSRDMLVRSDEIMRNIFSNGNLNTVSFAFQDDIKRAIARNYAAQTRFPSGSLACGYGGSAADLQALHRGERYNGYDILALVDPNCNPLLSYYRTQNYVAGEVSSGLSEMLTRLSWSGGIYDVEEVLPDGTRRVVTPGYLVAGSISDHLGAGLQQQIAADDIDEMIGALFAGIGNAILSEAAGGLQGLIRGDGGRPSYLDQVVENSSAGVRDSAVNAALQILLAAREVQESFVANERATAGLLASAAAELRGAENRCWDIIIPKVKEYAAVGDCTGDGAERSCTGSFNLRIATSTAESQKLISTFIAPLASSTAERILSSSRGLDNVDRLIAGVIDSSDPEKQSAALKTLDELVAQKALQNQYDLKASEDRRESIKTSIGNLVSDTIKTWGDDEKKDVGWCNVNNGEVIKMWGRNWKQ